LCTFNEPPEGECYVPEANDDGPVDNVTARGNSSHGGSKSTKGKNKRRGVRGLKHRINATMRSRKHRAAKALYGLGYEEGKDHINDAGLNDDDARELRQALWDSINNRDPDAFADKFSSIVADDILANSHLEEMLEMRQADINEHKEMMERAEKDARRQGLITHEALQSNFDHVVDSTANDTTGATLLLPKFAMTFLTLLESSMDDIVQFEVDKTKRGFRYTFKLEFFHGLAQLFGSGAPMWLYVAWSLKCAIMESTGIFTLVVGVSYSLVQLFLLSYALSAVKPAAMRMLFALGALNVIDDHPQLTPAKEVKLYVGIVRRIFRRSIIEMYVSDGIYIDPEARVEAMQLLDELLACSTLGAWGAGADIIGTQLVFVCKNLPRFREFCVGYLGPKGQWTAVALFALGLMARYSRGKSRLRMPISAFSATSVGSAMEQITVVDAKESCAQWSQELSDNFRKSREGLPSTIPEEKSSAVVLASSASASERPVPSPPPDSAPAPGASSEVRPDEEDKKAFECKTTAPLFAVAKSFLKVKKEAKVNPTLTKQKVNGLVSKMAYVTIGRASGMVYKVGDLYVTCAHVVKEWTKSEPSHPFLKGWILSKDADIALLPVKGVPAVKSLNGQTLKAMRICLTPSKFDSVFFIDHEGSISGSSVCWDGTDSPTEIMTARYDAHTEPGDSGLIGWNFNGEAVLMHQGKVKSTPAYNTGISIQAVQRFLSQQAQSVAPPTAPLTTAP
jgi:hypothetical protein